MIASLLCLTILRTQADLPSPDIKAIWSSFARHGFEPKPGSGSGGYGSVRIDGHKIDLYFLYWQGKAGSQPVIGVNARYGYYPISRPSDRFATVWMNDDLRPQYADRPAVKVDLDGQVRMVLEENRIDASPDDLVGVVEHFSYEIGEFQNEFPPATNQNRRDPMRVKLDESLKIDCLDLADAMFLVERWGWTYHGGWGGSTPSWIYPAQINGVVVTLSGSHPGRAVYSSFGLSVTRDVPNTGSLDRTKLPGTTVSLGPGRISVYTTVDLSKGMSLRQIHDKILGFASEVSKSIAPTRP